MRGFLRSGSGAVTALLLPVGGYGDCPPPPDMGRAAGASRCAAQTKNGRQALPSYTLPEAQRRPLAVPTAKQGMGIGRGVPIMGDIITLTTINEEPRVLDTDLAEALGMDRARNIRVNVIEPNRAELEGFGSLLARKANPGPSGGRPSTAYYLNEEQALLVCLLSRTERAKAVRAEVIRVFTAYRKGQLQPALPDFTIPQRRPERGRWSTSGKVQ